MKFAVTVTLKKDVLDPQGKVVGQTLKNMGIKNLNQVRQGKFFEIDMNEKDSAKAESQVKEICEKWLKINKINYSYIFLRNNNDNRGDEIVKKEIFDTSTS